MSTIYEKDAQGVQHHVKTVSFPDGSFYELLLVDGYVPAVKNGTTGKIVRFEWDQLLIQAIDKGVNDEARGNENE